MGLSDRFSIVFGSVAVLLAAGCGISEGKNAAAPAPTCDELLRRTIALMRSGQSGNGHDALSETIEYMRIADCPVQLEVFTDYTSVKASISNFGTESCDSWLEYDISPTAIELLREDGLCETDISAPPAGGPVQEDHQPGEGIAWSEAINHVGTEQRVCGPLKGIGTSADDVFLNIGREYPDPARFTIVLWDVGGVEPVPTDTLLCASGLITQYEGVAQLELRSVSAVEVYGD